jgi:adenylosuccinate lyase
MLKDGLRNIYLPLLNQTIQRLEFLSAQGAKIPMLARTHGQPASPTILGKEIYVFVERLQKQLHSLRELPYPAKFGGATGNFNAHIAAYPYVNWVQFADDFVEGILGLQRSQTTTQIEHYDGLSAIFDNLRRINVILIDLCRDFWQYISMGYFGQMVNAREVGSSAMPHKVNPIDFENAEGNLGMANAFFDHMSNKLPVSRLQRDLTDSTVLRNVGVPIGYTVVALHSLIKGLGKLQINREIIAQDLDQNQAVIAEAIQVILKREGIADAYEQLKAITRTGAVVSLQTLQAFIDTLPVDETVKAELRILTPHNYTGNA